MDAHCCFRDARYFPVVPSGGRMNGFRLPALPLAVLAVWLATTLPVPAVAQQGSKSPVLVTADTLKYDQSLGLVSAEGKVELSQDTSTLLADMVTYSARDDQVTARGKIGRATGRERVSSKCKARWARCK